MSFAFGATSSAAKPAAGGLFGATASSAATPLFGASTTAVAPSLFGAKSSGTNASTPSLFGSTATSTPAGGGLLGGTTVSTAAPATGGLFGSTTSASNTAAPSLFGASASTASTPSLFGSTTAVTSAAPSLFGKPAVSSTTPSLFGATSASTATGTTSLFGTPAAASSSTATTTATSLGLGGTGQATGTTLSATSGTAGSLGATTSDKENVKEGEVPKPIQDLVALIKNRLKENKTMSDQFVSLSSDGSLKVKENINELQSKLYDTRVKYADNEAMVAKMSSKAVADLRLGKDSASLVGDGGRQFNTAAYQHAIQHICLVIGEFEDQICRYQDHVEQLSSKVDSLSQGEAQLSIDGLKKHLERFDQIFGTIAAKVFAGTEKVEELRAQMAADGGFVGVFRDPAFREPERLTDFSRLEGSCLFPAQATISKLYNIIKPQQAAAGTTSTGLFGASTGSTGGSLFGAPAASKSLFGSSGGTTSLFGTPAASSTGTSSLFPATSKPSSTFGSTLNNSASGLLFTSKK